MEGEIEREQERLAAGWWTPTPPPREMSGSVTCLESLLEQRLEGGVELARVSVRKGSEPRLWDELMSVGLERSEMGQRTGWR